MDINATETRDRLLSGSVNLDRLEKDVKSVIGMIRAALLHQCGHCSRGMKAILESPTCKWEISSHKDGEIDIQYSFRLGQQGLWDTVFSTTPTTLIAQNTSNTIQGVFEALPALIEGVRKQFPKIEREWRHIIAASYAYDR